LNFIFNTVLNWRAFLISFVCSVLAAIQFHNFNFQGLELVPSNGEDPLLASALRNNGDAFRKRRSALSLSPDIQVAGPNKIRVVNARLNISQRLNSYWLVQLRVADPFLVICF
jgi:hypothetical protein